MFKWLSKGIENARIAWSFSAYEHAKRQEHLAGAIRRYPTQRLEWQIAELARSPAREAAVKFDHPAAVLKAGIAVLSDRDRALSQKLAVFERDYKKEIEDLYRALEEVKDELDELYENKDDAHEAFNDAKASVEHWYRMSDCYLGNRGREIPKSRVFGRSQNDLNRYKSEKSLAATSLSDIREEIGSLRSERESLYEQITELKSLRKQKNDLKSEGLSAERLKSAITNNRSSQSLEESRLRSLERERAAFLRQSRADLGIPDLENDLARTRKKREIFIQSFESSQARERRKEQHKDEWHARRIK